MIHSLKHPSCESMWPSVNRFGWICLPWPNIALGVHSHEGLGDHLLDVADTSQGGNVPKGAEKEAGIGVVLLGFGNGSQWYDHRGQLR